MKKKMYSSSVRQAVPAVLSAVLAAMSQTSDGGYLAGVAFVPLFLSILSFGKSSVKHTAVFMVTYHGIMCLFLMTLYDYLEIFRPISILLCALAVTALTALQSLVMMLAVYPAIAYTGRKSGLVRLVAFSACFAMGQYLLEIMPFLAFPWARVENSLAYYPVLIQSSSLFGGSFTAFVILLFNAVTALMLKSLADERVLKTLLYSALLALIFSLNLVGGAFYMLNKSQEGSITVAAVQGSQEGLMKNSQSSEDAIEEYSQLLSSESITNADLILLPETAIPGTATDDELNSLVQKIPSETLLITGCIYEDGTGRYNCMKPVGVDGSRHLKQVLVPLGEYVPFIEIDGFSSLTAYDKGDSISAGGHKYAASICIESIFSTLLSEQITSGSEMILISTNDSWFKNSYARNVHFRHSIIRAVEYDRSVIRSGNCGISAVIGRSGKVVSALYGKDAGVLVCNADFSSTQTLYSIVGNIIWLPVILFVSAFYVERIASAIFKKYGSAKRV